MMKTPRPLTRTEMGLMLGLLIVISLVSTYSGIDEPVIPMSPLTQLLTALSLLSAVTVWAGLMVTFRIIRRRMRGKE